MELKDVIRSARKRAHLTQKELADLAGCKQQTIVDVESGRIRRSSYLPEICKVLALDYEALMSDRPADATRPKRDNLGPMVQFVPPSKILSYLRDPSALPHEGATFYPCGVEHSERTICTSPMDLTMSPVLEPDDKIFVDPDRPWSAGDIVCVLFAGASYPTFRRLYIDGRGKGFQLVADNGKVTTRVDLVMTLDELEELSHAPRAPIPGEPPIELALYVGRAIYKHWEL